MKLFEIPIYAFDKKGLNERIDRWKTRNYKNASEFADSILTERKRYEYNHIVGFVKVEIVKIDIYIDLYLPWFLSRTPITIGGIYIDNSNFYKRRYIWHTSHKIFLEDMGVNGTHFNASNLNNKEIVSEIDGNMLIIRQCVFDYNKSYYIDDEAYRCVKDNIDYTAILEMINKTEDTNCTT